MTCFTACNSLEISRRGFSLIEVLLAVMILGVGIISIAALFPAGIAQQRLANDDVMGPIVANNAISIIRSRVRQEDFGTFEEYERFFPDGYGAPQAFYSRTVPGDWDWMRPGVLLEDDTNTSNYDEFGAIDIFSHRYTWQAGWGLWDGQAIAVDTEFPDGWPHRTQYWQPMGGAANNVPLFGIPYNTRRYVEIDPATGDEFLRPPNFLISQRERYYPMQSGLVNHEDDVRPQYVWDCMFRRFQGRVYVAIFVYRVTADDRGTRFVVPERLPYHLDLVNEGAPYNSGARDVWYHTTDNLERALPFILGSENVGNPNNKGQFDPDLHEQAWQRPRQWLLDQNNNVHRVVSVEHIAGDSNEPHSNAMRIELLRPLHPVTIGWWSNNTRGTINSPEWGGTPFANELVPSDVAQYYYADPDLDRINVAWPLNDAGVVTDLWYMPRYVEVDGVEFTITPVFVTVKEL